ncbi:hypothetical protein [Streptomyces abikoensis]|uniref:hypothetical protein n=1 Tax=Streptomyces abikoensis TaxID=97398 RepID=UPI0016743857|nr:hypothetical protein [Streptomyces abikoensis]GGP52553.1 hypothetical protein GCM10010214_27170 [Streptomyces abikoensis]
MSTFRLRPVDALWAAARSIEVAPRWSTEAERSVMVGDVDEIAELANLLEVDPSGRPFDCMCLGDVSFTVRGEMGAVLGVLTLHLDSRLDWPQWDGQMPLLRPDRLNQWLVEHGVIDPHP